MRPRMPNNSEYVAALSGKFIGLISSGLAIARISSAWFPVTVKNV